MTTRGKSGAPGPLPTDPSDVPLPPAFSTHREAVETAVTATGLANRDVDAPLVALLRTLADQMDAAGSEPSTRLTAAYLSALKDLKRATGPGRSGTEGGIARRRQQHLRQVRRDQAS